MAAALDILRKEHRAIARVLHMLRDIVEDDAVLARGVESGLIAAMLRYLHVFPYGVHHPKEEQQLFPAMAARDSGAVAAVAALVEEHAAGYAFLNDTRRALTEIGSQGGSGRLRRAIQNCIAHETRHMKREEDEILPV
ncbi:MAG: hypothetical protein FJX37_02445, partial [Alphaproteobacteria bacterium]|nr:hypothetical protein [Alphaproteobacteria bacterium]